MSRKELRLKHFLCIFAGALFISLSSSSNLLIVGQICCSSLLSQKEMGIRWCVKYYDIFNFPTSFHWNVVLDIFQYHFGSSFLCISVLLFAASLSRHNYLRGVQRKSNDVYWLADANAKSKCDWYERWTAAAKTKQPETMNHNSYSNKITQ